jgi:hypothetical protein
MISASLLYRASIFFFLLYNMHNEKLHNLHASPIIIGVIKTRSMMWAGHAVCMGDEKCIQNFGQKI